MKNKTILLLSIITIFLFGCTKDDSNDVPADLAINNFIWKGLNQYYLWQADVPDLADDKFGNQENLNTFLRSNNNSSDFFYILLFKPSRFNATGAVDRFSVIFDDFERLEGLLSGNTVNNGADYGLKYTDASQTNIFGWVRYVLPNSDAAAKGVLRGMIFTGINGQTLTASNYQSLLSATSYTINLANYTVNNGVVSITPNGQSISLTGVELAENPVYKTNVITQGTKKIGYLMYNGFYSDATNETALNAAFGQFKSANITDLVLDLRYNSGGSIATAGRLASMITGQFAGQVFGKQQWNAKAQKYFEDNSPNDLLDKFTTTIGSGQPINSLNLSKIYVLTSKSTASASELVINGLVPYISVVQLGDDTVGKNVGSVTLYDSKNFGKTDANKNHKYAMQPLVLRIANNAGFGDYTTGLKPLAVNKFVEDFSNLGVIGESTEPFLSFTLNRILNGARQTSQKETKVFKDVINLKDANNFESEMYLDKVPMIFRK